MSSGSPWPWGCIREGFPEEAAFELLPRATVNGMEGFQGAKLWREDSEEILTHWEKTLMLGKIEGRRRRG